MNMEQKTIGVVLAAGKGTRMRNEKPKVLHEFRGKTFIASVCEAMSNIADDTVVVLGHAAEDVQRELPPHVRVALQEHQRGTGDAVRVALGEISEKEGSVLVVPGDHPHLESQTLGRILDVLRDTAAVMVFATAIVPDYIDWRSVFVRSGRIVRDGNGAPLRIVEYRDATEEERVTTEVNVSIYAFDLTFVRAAISLLEPKNAAGELYLTDLVRIAMEKGHRVVGLPLEDIRQGMGVNTPEDLEMLERVLCESAR